MGIFGATNYTTDIDTWSLGCVLAELLLGHPLFPGESGVDQLVEIIKILGPPGRRDIDSMNKTYTAFCFPSIKPYPGPRSLEKARPPRSSTSSQTCSCTPRKCASPPSRPSPPPSLPTPAPRPPPSQTAPLSQ